MKVTTLRHVCLKRNRDQVVHQACVLRVIRRDTAWLFKTRWDQLQSILLTLVQPRFHLPDGRQVFIQFATVRHTQISFQALCLPHREIQDAFALKLLIPPLRRICVNLHDCQTCARKAGADSSLVAAAR